MRVMSPTSQPQPRTSGNSQSSSRCRNQHRREENRSRATPRDHRSSAEFVADFFNNIGAWRMLASVRQTAGPGLAATECKQRG